MQDLKDVTNNVHYENFRYNKLASVTNEGKNKNASGKWVKKSIFWKRGSGDKMLFEIPIISSL